MSNAPVAITTIPIATRLPVPHGIQSAHWRVLTEVIFPAAKSAESILLAIEYCRERGLDIMKRPVNIVPVWNSQLGREVETVWPAITEAHVTAARTGRWAGLEPPDFGPTKTETFKGRHKDKRGNWSDAAVTVSFPEWCEVRVYRLVGAERYSFTERVYWLESYGRVGGSTLPNNMWTKRPFSQFAKVAKAASLRAAFPEEEGGTPTAEEMEGQTIDEAVTDPPAIAQQQQPAAEQQAGWQPPQQTENYDEATGEVIDAETKPELLELIVAENITETWPQWGQRFLKRIAAATTIEAVEAWEKANDAVIKKMVGEAPKIEVRLKAAINRRRLELTQDEQQAPSQGDA